MRDSTVGSEPLIGMGPIVPLSAVTGTTPEGGSKSIRLSATPNPTTSQTTLAFSMPTEGPAELDLYDLLGRRIKNWSWSSLPAGDHRIVWDGQSADGKPVTAAIVFCRLTVGGATTTTRIIRTE